MLVRILQEDGTWYLLKILPGKQGEIGPPGEKGEQGEGLRILDGFETVEALRAAHPTGEPGEVYAVGTHLHIWSSTKSDWYDMGEVAGLPGPPGTDGRDGVDGQDGQDGAPGSDGQDGLDGVGIATVEQTKTSNADGGTNEVTITLTDGRTFTFQILNGKKGNTGDTPTAFPASSMTGVLSLAHGGTGVTTLTALKSLLGIGSAQGFVTGTYTGNYKYSVTTRTAISLGFQPSFIIVFRVGALPSYWFKDTDEAGDIYRESEQNFAIALPGQPATLSDDSAQTVLEVTSTGFAVANGYYSTSTRDYEAALNWSGYTFGYIAGK